MNYLVVKPEQTEKSSSTTDMFDNLKASISESSSESLKERTINHLAKECLISHLSIMGIETTMHRLNRWIRISIANKQEGKKGRKVAIEFEKDLWGELILVVYDKDDDEPKEDKQDEPKKKKTKGKESVGEKGKIVANVVYTYAIVVRAAEELQKSEKYKDDKLVQRFKFSNRWVRNFLHRNKFVRRRITREEKNIPSEVKVREVMTELQKKYNDNKIKLAYCYNMDETGINWQNGPLYMYVPDDADRATGSAASKARITAIIAGNVLGEFAPVMVIVKHAHSSKTHPDQTKHTVLDILMRKLNKLDDNNWELFVWEKEIEEDGNKIKHMVKYLKHKTRGHIITSQYKAWNDTIRQMMWLDLVMGPIQKEAEKTGDKVFVVQDNCGLHKTFHVEQQYVVLNMLSAFLPENMTATLQVMDLMVNGLLKVDQRRNAANDTFLAFRKYRNEVKVKGYNNVPKFKAPRPHLHDGILNLFKQFDNGPFISENFKASMAKCFQDTGCAANEFGEFKQYTESKVCCGSTSISNSSSVIDLTVDEINLNNLKIDDIVGDYIESLQNLDDEDNEILNNDETDEFLQDSEELNDLLDDEDDEDEH